MTREQAYEDANRRWPLPLSGITPEPPVEEPGEHPPEPEPDEDEEEKEAATLYASENFGMVIA